MVEPPSGTVTFLFTDIEGSTRLWENQPAAMALAQERHDVLVRNAIEANGGYLYQQAGDSFAAAFRAAPNAAAAAAAAQRALYAADWPVDPPLRVRMGLHTGEAHWQGIDYRAPCLNRLSRLVRVARGGQTVVSLATHDLIRDRLPDGVSLRDLGEHRLRDLSQPERIYQLLIDGVPNDFAGIASLDRVPNNLPSPATSFVGRKYEIRQVRQQLAGTRLLTLTGMGGVGKTRMALQVAGAVIDEYADGAWFVELAPLADPSLVAQAVAAIWDLPEQPGRPLADSLVDYLRGKRLLLILDNCEHVIEEAALLVERLVSAARNLRIMTTSREVLNIAGETVHTVRALGLPEPGATLAPNELILFEAVSLFAERAAAVRPSFKLTEANAPLVASICQRLEGIPLATELAAALTRAMSLEEINARLEDRFTLLTSSGRGASARQRTLQSTLDYSYNLLAPAEAGLFRRLSVFRGGWTVEEAEAVCQGGDVRATEMLDLLIGLVDKSLVIPAEREGPTRYGFLETLRDYSALKLRELGEEPSTRQRHLDYFLAFAGHATARVQGPEQVQWLERFEEEHDNLRAALAYAEQSGAVRQQLELAGSLFWFWRRAAHFTEALTQLERAAGLPNAAAYPALLAMVLAALGSFNWLRGDFPAAKTVLDHALGLARAAGPDGRYALATGLQIMGATLMRLGDRDAATQATSESAEVFQELNDLPGLGGALFTLSRIAIEGGDFELAWARAQASYEANRAAANDYGSGLALTNLGLIALQRRDYATARAMYEENLEVMRRINDRWGAAVALVGLAELAQMEMDLALAAARFDDSLNISRQLGNTGDIARCLRGLGIVACYAGNLASAARHLGESLDLYQVAGQPRGVAEWLESCAALAVACRQFANAAELLAASDAFLATHSIVRWPVNAFDFERTLAAARAGADEAAFDAAWAKGRALTMEQAIAHAREVIGGCLTPK